MRSYLSFLVPGGFHPVSSPIGDELHRAMRIRAEDATIHLLKSAEHIFVGVPEWIVVAHADHLFWAVYVLPGQLRDVDQAIYASQIDKGAERHDTAYGPGMHLALG